MMCKHMTNVHKPMFEPFPKRRHDIAKSILILSSTKPIKGLKYVLDPITLLQARINVN